MGAGVAGQSKWVLLFYHLCSVYQSINFSPRPKSRDLPILCVLFPLSRISHRSIVSPHPSPAPPNIPACLLLRVFCHVPLELLHLALFGFHTRNSDSFGHLPAYGFGLAGGRHGWMCFLVGGGWVGGLFVGFGGVDVEDLGECCCGCLRGLSGTRRGRVGDGLLDMVVLVVL